MTRTHYHLSGTTCVRDFRTATVLFGTMIRSLNSGWHVYPTLTFDLCHCPAGEDALAADFQRYGNEYQALQRIGLAA